MQNAIKQKSMQRVRTATRTWTSCKATFFNTTTHKCSEQRSNNNDNGSNNAAEPANVCEAAYVLVLCTTMSSRVCAACASAKVYWCAAPTFLQMHAAPTLHSGPKTWGSLKKYLNPFQAMN